MIDDDFTEGFSPADSGSHRCPGCGLVMSIREATEQAECNDCYYSHKPPEYDHYCDPSSDDFRVP